MHAPEGLIAKGLADRLVIAAAPGLFILLWSSGFIGGKYGLPYAEPFTFLSIRMIVAVALLAVLIAIGRPPWPGGAAVGHNMVAGLLVHGCYLGGVFTAISNGLPTGVVALIVSLQPVLTATVANRAFGERVGARQWLGLALGLAGVFLVVEGKLGSGDTHWVAWPAITIALLGITAGTLYQKRFGAGIDWRAQFLIQYAAAFCLFGLGALLFETRTVEWTAQFVFALAWLVFVMSFGAIWLFFFLIKRTGATAFTSLLYMMPPVTAVMAWFAFDERLSALSLAGMAVCVAGVFLVNRGAANRLLDKAPVRGDTPAT
jgi:drug/metabolite transporter (DMT)-like permease